ncbi:MAG TPA: hypothetical protein VGH16_10530 [Candidatus Binatia bacterium]|jgi:hypothetical protein
MKFAIDTFLRAFILLFLLASVVVEVHAADIERGRTITDETTKKDVQEKIRRLFPSRKADVERINGINLPIFRGYKLLRVAVYEWMLLEHPFMPGPGSFGMFAYGQGKLIYLNRANDNLEKILWAERQGRVETIDPEVMAHVLILCKLSKGAVHADLVKTSGDILSYEKDDQSDSSGYVVNKEKLARHKRNIDKPRWESRGSRQILTFYILWGWMHDVQELSKVTASFDRSSANVSIDKEILESKIFDEVPDVIY